MYHPVLPSIICMYWMLNNFLHQAGSSLVASSEPEFSVRFKYRPPVPAVLYSLLSWLEKLWNYRDCCSWNMAPRCPGIYSTSSDYLTEVQFVQDHNHYKHLLVSTGIGYLVFSGFRSAPYMLNAWHIVLWDCYFILK